MVQIPGGLSWAERKSPAHGEGEHCGLQDFR